MCPTRAVSFFLLFFRLKDQLLEKVISLQPIEVGENNFNGKQSIFLMAQVGPLSSSPTFEVAAGET